MTHEERSDIYYEVALLDEQGKEDEAMALFMTAPLPAHIARIAKKVYGADFLIKSGYDLSDAEAEYGKDWLNR
jgi:hypothetical protein